MNITYFIPTLIFLFLLACINTKYSIYVILSIIPAYLIKTQILFIPTTLLELSIYTVFTSYILKLIILKKIKPTIIEILKIFKPYIIPVIILLFSICVSIIISEHKQRALGILKAWFLDPLILWAMFISLIKSKKDIQKSIFYLSLSCVPIIIYGIVDYLLNIKLTIPGRLDSFFESPNYVAMYITPIIIMSLGILFIKPKEIKNSKALTIYFILFTAISITTLILTKSFGGIFSLTGGIILLSLFFIPNIATIKKIFIVSAVFLFITATIFTIYQKSITHFDTFWQANSLETRKEIWINSIKILSRHPILGIGLADFKTDYLSFINNLPPLEQPIEKEVLRPHNLYLDFWLETGLLGIMSFLWIILIFFYKSSTEFKHNKSYIICLSSMLAILLHGFVDTPYFKNDLSILFWSIIFIPLLYNKIKPPMKKSLEV